jgi:hypothetical protein
MEKARFLLTCTKIVGLLAFVHPVQSRFGIAQTLLCWVLWCYHFEINTPIGAFAGWLLKKSGGYFGTKSKKLGVYLFIAVFAVCFFLVTLEQKIYYDIIREMVRKYAPAGMNEEKQTLIRDSFKLILMLFMFTCFKKMGVQAHLFVKKNSSFKKSAPKIFGVVWEILRALYYWYTLFVIIYCMCNVFQIKTVEYLQLPNEPNKVENYFNNILMVWAFNEVCTHFYCLHPTSIFWQGSVVVSIVIVIFVFQFNYLIFVPFSLFLFVRSGLEVFAKTKWTTHVLLIGANIFCCLNAFLLQDMNTGMLKLVLDTYKNRVYFVLFWILFFVGLLLSSWKGISIKQHRVWKIVSLVFLEYFCICIVIMYFKKTPP